MESLHEKVIFVHDSAHPLSDKIALELLQAGAFLILSSKKYLKHDLLMDQARELGAFDRLHILSFNLKSSEDHVLAKKAVLRGWGGLDAFISLPEYNQVCTGLSKANDQDWENAMNRQLKNHFTLARAFMPLLALRKSSVYINVSSSSVLHSTPGHGIEGISHCVRFLMAQTLSIETQGNPSIHNLVVSSTPEAGDNLISASNIGSAISTLLRHAEFNRGYLEFDSNWRDRMEEPDELCVGGI